MENVTSIETSLVPAAAPGTSLAEPGVPPRIDQNPALAYIAQLRSPASRTTQGYSLASAASVLSPGTPWPEVRWAELRHQHVAAIVSALLEREYAAASVNRTIMALRGVAKQAWMLGQIPLDAYEHIRAIRPEKIEEKVVGRPVPIEEYALLLRACAGDGTAAGARDAAIVAVLYGCGLRRAEAAALLVEDYDDSLPRPTLAIRRGKGRKPRSQYAPEGTALAVGAWLARRGRAPGPLFVAVNKADAISTVGLTGGGIFRVLRRRVKAAGLRPIRPHDCRRSLATDLLDQGTDIAIVRKILGHASIATTVRYDRRDERAQAAAIDKLRVPFPLDEYK